MSSTLRRVLSGLLGAGLLVAALALLGGGCDDRDPVSITSHDAIGPAPAVVFPPQRDGG
jgi:hypothetical protein